MPDVPTSPSARRGLNGPSGRSARTSRSVRAARLIRFLCFFAAASCAVAAGAADDREMTLGGGLHYSSGNYGTAEKTSILSLPLTARYDADPWILKLPVPWIRITGATGVVPGVGRVGGQGTRQSAAGIGDIRPSATYAAYYDAAARAGFDVPGKLKLGTADRDRGLGTGEDDVAFFVEPFTPLGRWTLFGALGYHMLGSSPAIPLRDVWSASVGVSLPLQARGSVGV